MPKPKVLIIDDNREVRTLLNIALRQLYDVTEAPDGLLGWRRVEEQRPDVVVTDMAMPGHTGLEIAQRVKAHPELSSTIVILITGAVAGEDLPDAFWKKGTDADEFISKPFDPQVLVAKIQELLERRAGFRPLPPGTGSYG